VLNEKEELKWDRLTFWFRHAYDFADI